MIKELLRLARGPYGIWNELRRLNRNIEWVMASLPEIGLPPSKKDITDALDEKYEVALPFDEERLGGEAAMQLLMRRRRGEKEDDLPGKDWRPL